MKKYMLFVKGGCCPKKMHDTLESAQSEASRLALLRPTARVFVFEVITVIEPTQEKPKVVVVEKKVKQAKVKQKEVEVKPVVSVVVKQTPAHVMPIKIKTANTLSLPKRKEQNA